MNGKAKRFKILIVDDHEVVRMGLRTLLERHEDLEIIGEAASAQEAVDTSLKTLPDVVLMDVRLPDRSGIEACREIRTAEPGIRVLMLTSYSDDEAVVASVIA
ncbi:MAG: response regulator transcription factor, partial [Actinomycetota bacterium]